MPAFWGGFGATVEKTEEIAGAFEAARALGLPALLEPRLNHEAITPRQAFGRLRVDRSSPNICRRRFQAEAAIGVGGRNVSC
jgi:hypothetical protein